MLSAYTPVTEDHEETGSLTRQISHSQCEIQVAYRIADGKRDDDSATNQLCFINTGKMRLKEFFSRLGDHSRSIATVGTFRAHIRHSNGHDDLFGQAPDLTAEAGKNLPETERLRSTTSTSDARPMPCVASVAQAISTTVLRA